MDSKLTNLFRSSNKYVRDTINDNKVNIISPTNLTTSHNIFYSNVLKGHFLYSKSSTFITYLDINPFPSTVNSTYPTIVYPMVGNINKIWDCVDFGRVYILTSSRIYYTLDGINYLPCTITPASLISSFTDIDYSPKLDLFVATVSSGSYGPVILSKNGIQWHIPIYSSYASEFMNSIKWIPSFGMFIGIKNNSTYSQIITSYNGINWVSSANTNNKYFIETSLLSNIEYSPVANIAITRVQGTSGMLYGTYNGIVWFRINASSQVSVGNIKYINELECFVCTINNPGANIFKFSQDGINWNCNIYTTNPTPASYSSFNNNITYSKILNSLITTVSSGNPGIIFTKIDNSSNDSYNYQSTILETSDRLKIDNVNKRVGIGISNPSYSLHLSTDSAYKASSSTWLTSSDERLKENIELADLSICYNNILNIPLKKFKWKEDIYTNEQISNDRNKIGWIAQDVEQYIPKAVNKFNNYGIEDCRDLNIDQIITNMYGCVKYLIQKDIELEQKLNL